MGIKRKLEEYEPSATKRIVTEELVTVKEAAQNLKVRRETIRRYIKKGYLKAVTLPGGDYRLYEGDIQKLLSRPVKRG